MKAVTYRQSTLAHLYELADAALENALASEDEEMAEKFLDQHTDILDLIALVEETMPSVEFLKASEPAVRTLH